MLHVTMGNPNDMTFPILLHDILVKLLLLFIQDTPLLHCSPHFQCLLWDGREESVPVSVLFLLGGAEQSVGWIQGSPFSSPSWWQPH